MDKIYYNAEFTIVDAVGADASHGLAGICPVSRSQQCEKVGNVKLIQGFRHTQFLLEDSPWASRGWTFQESILSRRRIIFTKHGVSYLCNSMNMVEWERLPFHASDCNSILYGNHFDAFMPTRDRLKDHVFLKIGASENMIERYTGRQLSRQEDAFNACRGILNFLRDSSTHTLWGIPVTPRSMCLAWKHNEPTPRVAGFPSWSFLGWQGSIHQLAAGGLRIRSKAYLGGIDPDNRCYDLDQIENIGPEDILRDEENKNCELRYLHLTEHVIDLPLVYMDWTTNEWMQNHKPKAKAAIYASLKVTQNVTLLTRVQLDTEGFSGRTRGLVMMEGYDPNKPERPIPSMRVLVIEDHGDFYERIGAIWVYGNGKCNMNSYYACVYMNQAGDIIPELDRTDLQAEDSDPKRPWEEDFHIPLWFKEAKKETIILG